MTKGKQGFASMDSEKQRAIASKGGVEAHRQGKAHEWTKEEASIAGKKGGLICQANKRKHTNGR